jgi:hypothetical protein
MHFIENSTIDDYFNHINPEKSNLSCLGKEKTSLSLSFTLT